MKSPATQIDAVQSKFLGRTEAHPCLQGFEAFPIVTLWKQPMLTQLILRFREVWHSETT